MAASALWLLTRNKLTGSNVDNAVQILLVVSGGASVGRLPIMALAFFVMLRSWLGSVRKLATFSNCSMTHVDSTIDEADSDRYGSVPEDRTTASLKAIPSLGGQ